MSRRAVLKAIAMSPIAASVSSSLARADEHGAASEAVGTLWDSRFDTDLDDVVTTATQHYEDTHGGKKWPDPRRNRYREVVKNLWTFFLLGIDHASPGMEPEPGLMKKIFETKDAGGNVVTDSGKKLVANLQFFEPPHGTTEKRTEVCAWRCGYGAAQEQLKRTPGATTVGVEAYDAAWVPLSQEVFGAMERLKAARPMMVSSAGAC